jgi:hypothetical protein
VALAAEVARASCTREIGEVAALAAGLLEGEQEAADGNPGATGSRAPGA